MTNQVCYFFGSAIGLISPLAGGLLQANAIVMVLPLRRWRVVLQPSCIGASLRSAISLVMHICTFMPAAPASCC
jgi:hypothetical protein